MWPFVDSRVDDLEKKFKKLNEYVNELKNGLEHHCKGPATNPYDNMMEHLAGCSGCVVKRENERLRMELYPPHHGILGSDGITHSHPNLMNSVMMDNDADRFAQFLKCAGKYGFEFGVPIRPYLDQFDHKVVEENIKLEKKLITTENQLAALEDEFLKTYESYLIASARSASDSHTIKIRANNRLEHVLRSARRVTK